MSTKTSPMPYKGHLKATLVLGLPIIGSNLAQMAVAITDTIMVGWYGVDELAALVLGASVYALCLIVGSGFAIAVVPMVAGYVSDGDQTQIRRVVRMGLWMVVIYTAFLMPLLWNFEALMLAIGQKPEIAAMAQDYMRIIQWSLFPSMLVFLLNGFLSALERPAWVLWTTLFAAGLNALLNWVLIFGNWGVPELGVEGAAISSLLTGFAAFFVLAVYTQVENTLAQYSIFTRIWRPDWPALREVFRLGWPISSGLLAEAGLFSASALMMGWIGTKELATHGIAVETAAVSFMAYSGLATVVTVRVGRALGRNDILGILRASVTVGLLQMSLAAVIIAVFLCMPELLIGLFLDNSNPDSAAIIAYGVGLLVVASAFQVVDGLQVVVLGVLRGLKDTKVPMLCAVVSYWLIGVPASYFLGFTLGFGGYGIWAGLAVGLAVAAATLTWRFLWLMRRLPGQ